MQQLGIQTGLLIRVKLQIWVGYQAASIFKHHQQQYVPEPASRGVSAVTQSNSLPGTNKIRRHTPKL